jgi:formiminotetrahydrofolate cyclodeaminase
VAGLLGVTALEGAALNVRINVGAIKDEAVRRTLTERLQAVQASGRDQAAKVRAVVAGKLG